MDADVLVVGGGPAGLVVANELRVQGSSVLVVERRERGVQSRAGSVLPRVLELLDYRGHAQRWIDRARKISDEPLSPVYIWAGLQPIHWGLLGGAFPYSLVVPQSETELLLLDIAREQGVEVRYGQTVTDLLQDDSGVTVTATSANDEKHTYTARYVVGADGGRSAVRSLAGIGFPGHDGTFTGMIADVRGDIRWPGGRVMKSNRHGWAMSFPFGPDGELTRFNIVHAERRAASKDETVTQEEIRRTAEEILGGQIPIDEVVWASRFDDTMRKADRLRQGRVLLVGEATRVHYPASGVGMNFCIQDAFNLGWKLGKVVRGEAADALLDSYEAERLPIIDGLLESVRAQLAVQFDFSEQGAALRTVIERDLLPQPDMNRALGRQLLGLTSAYPTVPGGHAFEGRPVPEAAVQAADGLHRVASLLAEGDFVLLDLSRQNVFPQTVRSTRVVRGVLSAPSTDLQGVTALLIRPDGYVQWASDAARPNADAALAALDRLLDGSETEASVDTATAPSSAGSSSATSSSAAPAEAVVA